MDLALQNKDWKWCENILEISNKSMIDLIDEEIVKILNNIENMGKEQLEQYFPQVIYAINNSDMFAQKFLRQKFKEMKLRHRDLTKKEG